MSGEPSVKLTLTDEQVTHVVRQASDGVGLAVPLSWVSDREKLRGIVRPLWDDDRLSRSLLSGLLVLASFPVDGSERMLTAVAKELGFSSSTTYRYLSTLLAVGLLERDPATRRYSRPPSRSGAGVR